MGGSQFGEQNIADTSRFPTTEPRSKEDVSEDLGIPKHRESLHDFALQTNLLLPYAIAQIKGSTRYDINNLRPPPSEQHINRTIDAQMW